MRWLHFCRSENGFGVTYITAVEIHPAATGERIAKLVSDGLGLQCDSGEQRQMAIRIATKYFAGLPILTPVFEGEVMIVDAVRQLIFTHQR